MSAQHEAVEPTPPTCDRVGTLALLAPALVAGAVACAVAVIGGPDRALVAVLVVAVAAALVAAHQASTVRRLRRDLESSSDQARLDPLTGLLNRTGVVDELHARLGDRRSNEVVGVLFLDVDRLKLINDSIGHRGGDEVLDAVAGRVASVLRPGDTVGRLGGDEFVVVASGLRSVGDLSRLADRILAELAAPVALGDGSRQLATASIGIAYVLKGDASPEDLLRDADVAMYQAKDAGGSRHVVFDAELRARALARLELERELRRAVAGGQLAVQYQPIVRPGTGGVEVVEALVRWRHPTRGLIPPGHFLSVASESGLIVELGEQVLTAACSQAARWSKEAGRAIGVAVNLAERQLVDPALGPTVASVLAATGLPAAQLQLEISEELLAHRPERCLAVLRQLSAMGVRLALDDFGTTRASLGQLKALDMISTLKIDRSLAADVADDPVDRKIIAAVVALAESLGMAVVAEGVETAEQAAVLAGLGVGALQGFHFQRPSGPGDITPVLTGGFVVPPLGVVV